MTAWILSLLILLVPPGRHPRESEADARTRYASIAEDIAATTQDKRTAALLVAIAVHESALRVDVDEGRTRGGGRDRCLLQIRTSRELTRRECFAEGLRLVRASFGACRANPLRDRLAAYASGRCDAGLKESRAMVDAWLRVAP